MKHVHTYSIIAFMLTAINELSCAYVYNCQCHQLDMKEFLYIHIFINYVNDNIIGHAIVTDDRYVLV